MVACLALRGEQLWLLGMALGVAAWLAASERRRHRQSEGMMQREAGNARVWLVLGMGLAVAVMAALLGFALLNPTYGVFVGWVEQSEAQR